METDKLQFNINNRVTLADFTAPWCEPCRAQEPVIDNLIKKYQHRASFIKINIDEHRSLATEYRIHSIPTLILFKKGMEIRRFVGLQSDETIKQCLDEALQRLNSNQSADMICGNFLAK